MTVFGFGSTRWPGIAKLVEEAGEVIQVCGKLLMTHGKHRHWDGSDLKDRLEDEIADLMAACRFVVGWCGLDSDKIDSRSIDKMILFERWHHEQADTTVNQK
jgi:NTP pyrophosphatase (non-canonical NTP hydrolase)